MKIPAQDLIPQKAPFAMVDYLILAQETKSITHTIISKDKCLLLETSWSEAALLENMAQTCAAGSGYFFSQQNKEIPQGYIGAIKNINIYRLPILNDEIQTIIEITNKIGNASIAKAEIYIGNDCIANAEFTIFTAQNNN